MRRLGKQEPRYRFILNPYEDVRFTTCPICQGKTRQRKAPLLIHIDPQALLALNKVCRYCPPCDLLIAHQDEVERSLALLHVHRKPDSARSNYLVLGTLDRSNWRQTTKALKAGQDPGNMIEWLHDFKEVLIIEVDYGGWRPDN